MLNPQETELFKKSIDEWDKRTKRRPMLQSLSNFTKQAWHVVEPNCIYQHGWHIDAICEHLEACFRGDIRTLVINIPPRHMKSTLISIMFPAWVWTQAPEKRWLFASYAAALSTRDALKTRTLIESEWYRKEFGIKWKLSDDQNTKVRFNNTEGGYRISTSVGGGGTGEGGHYFCADDSLNAMDAHSPVRRQEVNDWWDQQMSSRFVDPKTFCRICIMQRLHEMDLSQHALNKGDAVHLCLPAEFENVKRRSWNGWTDPRTVHGELLWPERFPSEVIEKMKTDMGSMAAAGQLQQRPAPAEGNIVKREWWRFYKKIPEDLELYALSADLSFDKGHHASYVVLQIWGRKLADKYLLDQYRKQIGFVEQLQAFKMMCEKWPQLSAKWVEKKANGAALIDTLKREIPGIIPIEPRGSKELRAQAVAPQIESGNVFLPDPSIAPWVADFIEEWATIPNGAHDDQCFAAGTLISTLTGDRPIEDIRTGDLVFTPVGLRKVQRAWQTGIKKVVIRHGLTGTPDHKVFSNTKGLIDLDQSHPHELNKISCRSLIRWMLLARSISWDRHTISWVDRDAIISAHLNRPKIAKQRLRAYMWQFGSTLINERSLRALRYTTWTAMHLITIPVIWNVSRVLNIVRRLNKIWLRSKPISTEFVPSQRHGMHQKRDISGTQSMLKRAFTSLELLLKRSVKVAQNLFLLNPQSNFFAPILATDNGDVKTRGPITISFASFAENRQSKTLPPSQKIDRKPVATRAVESIAVPVYNMTVEQCGLYYANGILVSNCDAASQALLMLHKKSMSLNWSPVSLTGESKWIR